LPISAIDRDDDHDPRQDLRRLEEAPDGLDGEDRRDQEEQDGVRRRREHLEPVQAVRPRVGRRAGGDPDRDQGERHAAHVGEQVGGVGHERQRVRGDPRDELDDEDDGADPDRRGEASDDGDRRPNGSGPRRERSAPQYDGAERTVPEPGGPREGTVWVPARPAAPRRDDDAGPAARGARGHTASGSATDGGRGRSAESTSAFPKARSPRSSGRTAPGSPR
jgi:hypothetical protein